MAGVGVEAAPVPAPPATATPVMGLGKGITASLVVALFVALGEVNRLSGQVLDGQARSWSFTALMGPGAWGAVDGWSATFPAYGSERATWLLLYLALDVVLIVIYGYIVARWLAEHGAGGLAWTLRVLALVDVVEDGLALFTVHHPSEVMGHVTAVFSLGKCALVAVAVVVAGYLALQHRPVIRSWLRGIYTQRFSVIAILPIAVLTVPVGSDLLDQLPDVERRWFQSSWYGDGHFWAAVVAVLLTAVGLLVVGRLRSGVFWQRTESSVVVEEKANLWLGVIAPLVLGIGLVAVAVVFRRWPWALPGFDLVRLLFFLLVPVGIVAASLLIRRGRDKGWTWATSLFSPTNHQVRSAEDKVRISLVGDVLVAVALVVTGLGLIRAYTAVVALAVVDLGGSWFGLVPVVIGFGTAVVAWLLARWVQDRVTDDEVAEIPVADRTTWQRIQAGLTPTVPVPGNLVLRLGVLAAGLVLFFAVGLFPDWFADHLGVIATALGALLAATLVVGGCVVITQDRRSPEVFWLNGIQLTTLPVATLLILTIAWTTSIGSNVDIHGLRGLTTQATAPAGAADRPTFDAAMTDWLAATRGCGRSVTVGSVTYRLRPMFMLAAEGGGIRAAYWTAAALDIFRGAVPVQDGSVSWGTRQQPNPCATALFAGGASGGAVGLTVARFAGDGLAHDGAVAMAAPEALGAATNGLFVRDTAYAATGIPFFGAPTYSDTDAEQPRWLDRAGLIEQSWERTSGLSGPFLPGSADPATSAPTGSLVLNSTRVADGCRMWVSQIRLATGDQDSCAYSTGTPAGDTVDLLGALGSGADPTPPAQVRCLGSLTAATGTMLASRFPFVTPSGVVGPCAAQDEQQLVDGGYVENSGLGTIVDLAPQWQSEVQRRNGEALRLGGPTVDLIVPVVMYFDNGTGGDLAARPTPATPEILVPSTTSGRAKAALVDTPALLRNGARLVATSELGGPGGALPADLATEIEKLRGSSGVVVVQQSTFPAVTAPLGWVLSQQSMDTMDRALGLQATPTSVYEVIRPPSIADYETLAKAIEMTQTAAP